MHDLAPMLLALGLPLTGFALLGEASPLARGIASACGLGFVLRYLAWRWSLPLPAGGPAGSTVQQGWAMGFLLVESLAVLGSALLLLLMARHRDRSAEADAFAHLDLAGAPTDIFIFTTAEAPETLERSILGATRVAHADLRVWVLDDGARAWVERMADDLGALYVRREVPRHGKAGSIDNGLAHALRIGRRPEFLLLLDADVVPGRTILKRTLPLFHAADVGTVQTPRHVFNPEPGLAMPDAQRFGVNVLQPCLDAWGAAHGCGGAAVLRVAALEQLGGMALGSATTERLTSLKLAGRGWRSIFLDERLAQGLAPEGLADEIAQRARWGRGAVQQALSRWGFAGPGPVSLANRLAGLEAALRCCCTPLLCWLALLAPVLHWWFGIITFAAPAAEVLRHLAPGLLAAWVFMATLGGSQAQAPVAQLLASTALLRAVAGALAPALVGVSQPPARPRSTDQVVVQWRLLAPLGVLAVLTAGGMLLHLGGWDHGPGHALAIGWSLLNMALLGLAMAACVEPPRPRREERFTLDEAATLRLPDGSAIRCRVADMAVTGARLDCDWPAEAGDRAELVLDAPPLVLPLEVTRGADGSIAGRFIADAWLRQELIARLYTGDYANDAARVRLGGGLAAAMRRMLG